jgi:hypothetical protein
MNNNLAGIPVPVISINLNPDSPSKVTVDALKKELADIGLTCKHTEPENLAGYIREVVNGFTNGKVQSLKFFEYKGLKQNDYGTCDTSLLEISDVVHDITDIRGNWTPQDNVPRKTQLAAIGYPDHFDKLAATGFFAGHSSGQTYMGIGTVSALKTQFANISANISATMVKGLDKETMEAVFVNTIKPVDPESKDYKPGRQNRSIFILENYNDKTKECDALGVVNVEWNIVINNYRRKSKEGGDYNTYNLDIKVRTVLYNDLASVDADFARLQALLKDKMFFTNALAIPVPSPIHLFDSLPPETSDTFAQGIPLDQTASDYMDVIILHQGDLQNVGCLDNTKSDASTVYSKSITSGFTFTAGQKVSISMKFSLDALIAKSELSVGLEISFTEQWNNSQTETLSFSVPAGKKAFLYQGYVGSSILRFNIPKMTYKYIEHAKFLSNLVVTTNTALEGNPAKITLKRSPLIAGKEGKLPLWLRLK